MNSKPAKFELKKGFGRESTIGLMLILALGLILSIILGIAISALLKIEGTNTYLIMISLFCLFSANTIITTFQKVSNSYTKFYEDYLESIVWKSKFFFIKKIEKKKLKYKEISHVEYVRKTIRVKDSKSVDILIESQEFAENSCEIINFLQSRDGVFSILDIEKQNLSYSKDIPSGEFINQSDLFVRKFVTIKERLELYSVKIQENQDFGEIKYNLLSNQRLTKFKFYQKNDDDLVAYSDFIFGRGQTLSVKENLCFGIYDNQNIQLALVRMNKAMTPKSLNFEVQIGSDEYIFDGKTFESKTPVNVGNGDKISLNVDRKILKNKNIIYSESKDIPIFLVVLVSLIFTAGVEYISD